MEPRIIGTSVPRKEGREKVTGRARYVDDLSFPGMLYGVTVRSSVARGRIRKIHFESGIPWDEVHGRNREGHSLHQLYRPAHRRPARARR